MKKRHIFFLIGFLSTGSAIAETVYVSDRLEIQMRTGKGTEFRIKRTLFSGTQLDVLETSSDGYTRVITPGGTEGWVLSRYLMKRAAARERIAAIEKQFTALNTQNRKLKKNLSTVQQQKGSVDQEHRQLSQSNKRLTKELEEIKHTSQNALHLDKENKQLKITMVGYERQIQTLQQENEDLKDRSGRDWFMVGAGVILLGIILGLLIPKIRWRKKSSWDTL